jgi:ribosomal protein L7/L12
MKDSVVLYNNEGLAYGDKIDLNLRVFVENDDFLNSKIVLALTYYAPEPGTGTILHESVADVMLDNKDVFKLDNEYSYSGLDYYGATGYKLEICNENLAKVSARIEQIQFYIDLATLIKIVNAKTFEIRYNKKWGYGGNLYSQELLKFIGFYNTLFDNNFMKDKIISIAKYGHELNNKSINVKTWENALAGLEVAKKNNQRIIEYCKQGKKIEAIQIRKEFTGGDLVTSKKYVEDLCLKNRVKVDLDPVSSSKKNEEVERQKNIKKLFWYFLIYLVIALIIWLVKNN